MALQILRLFYQEPNDTHFYHIACKMVLQDYFHSISWDDDKEVYDYEFLFQNSANIYHVTCKLLSHSSILNILNKEFYGMDFDVTDLTRKNVLLTLRQKLNLELNLEQILPWHVSQHIPDSETRLDSLNPSNENASNNVMETQANSTFADQNTQYQKLNEVSLFYQSPIESNIYHVTCKIILQESENFASDNNDHDYEFFFQESTTRYYVTCKLLSNSLIVNILNKKIYGIDFNVTDFKQRYLLTLFQKLNLKQNLKKDLPLYFSQYNISNNEALLNSSENLNFSNEDTDNIFTVDNQDSFDNSWSYDDHISQ
ncbi:hypothetical protein C1645_816953 [Glomus cerebriforme]|uniref:Uncharacterized protein n=1 Tax=Glomus cerebriforme TaxID=658196 RepID=A0A397TK22_9GLOM|nr:hypothetical protein C1645_816953 [Glomus cerebriforme]